VAPIKSRFADGNTITNLGRSINPIFGSISSRSGSYHSGVARTLLRSSARNLMTYPHPSSRARSSSSAEPAQEIDRSSPGGACAKRWLASTGHAWLIGIALWLQGTAARAVIFYSTADPGFNTSAPTGALTNSGWQYEGQWVGFLGTAIAPQYFVAAHHVGGNIGAPFVYQGATYLTTAFFDDPDSDLRIWRVCGTFQSYSMLYTNSDETGKALVVFGRGTQRGAPVSSAAGVTNGWLWGLSDGVQRWGQNTVAGVVDGDQSFPIPGGRLGSLLRASFDAGGLNQATLSTGDSGGGVFLQDGADWKLAGINYGVDGFFNTSTNGPGFSAAIFDERGLYLGAEGNWTLIPDSPAPIAEAFYATRISSNLSWILSIINTTVPEDQPVLQSAPGAAGPYADDAGAVIDPQARTITLPTPAGVQFYRLRACVPLTFMGVRIASTNLVLTYGAP
jgi:hypothetical protein